MCETLRDLQGYIKQKLGNGLGQIREIRGIVNDLADSGKIKNLLNQLLKDPVNLAYIAAHSFTHPNGFDKITLLSHPGYTLRLHIWWPAAVSEEMEHIHNHSWNFSSAVLTGGFNFQLFQVTEKGEEMCQYLCGFPASDLGYSMNYLGQATLSCAFECLMPAGSVYSLSYETLHKIVNSSNQLTSTLMLHGYFLRSTSLLFSKERLQHGEEVKASPFTADSLANKLGRYLAILP